MKLLNIENDRLVLVLYHNISSTDVVGGVGSMYRPMLARFFTVYDYLDINDENPIERKLRHDCSKITQATLPI